MRKKSRESEALTKGVHCDIMFKKIEVIFVIIKLVIIILVLAIAYVSFLLIKTPAEEAVNGTQANKPIDHKQNNKTSIMKNIKKQINNIETVSEKNANQYQHATNTKMSSKQINASELETIVGVVKFKLNTLNESSQLNIEEIASLSKIVKNKDGIKSIENIESLSGIKNFNRYFNVLSAEYLPVLFDLGNNGEIVRIIDIMTKSFNIEEFDVSSFILDIFKSTELAISPSALNKATSEVVSCEDISEISSPGKKVLFLVAMDYLKRNIRKVDGKLNKTMVQLLYIVKEIL